MDINFIFLFKLRILNIKCYLQLSYVMFFNLLRLCDLGIGHFQFLL